MTIIDSTRSGGYLYAISVTRKIKEYRFNSSLAGASIPDGPWPGNQDPSRCPGRKR